MESLAAKLRRRDIFHDLSLCACRRSNPTPVYSLSFATPPPSSISSQPSIKASSLYQNSKSPFIQIMIIPTTIAVAASAFLFMRSYNTQIMTAPIVSLEEEEQEKSIRALKPFKVNHPVQSFEYYRLKEGSISVRFIELESNDSDLPLLKARIRSSSQGLQTAKKGFQEVLEKDPGRVKGYVEDVEELIDVLKDLEAAIDAYLKEKEKLDLSDLNKVLVRARILEWKFFEALKDMQEGHGVEED